MKLSGMRSLKWSDVLIYSIVDPRAMYRQLKEYERLPLALSFLIPAMVAVTDIIAGSLLGGGNSFFYYRITYGWILHFLLLSFFILVTSSLMDLAGQFTGLRGNVKELIALINFSLFPRVLSASAGIHFLRNQLRSRIFLLVLLFLPFCLVCPYCNTGNFGNARG